MEIDVGAHSGSLSNGHKKAVIRLLHCKSVCTSLVKADQTGNVHISFPTKYKWRNRKYKLKKVNVNRSDFHVQLIYSSYRIKYVYNFAAC